MNILHLIISSVHSSMVLEKNSSTELAALELIDRLLAQLNSQMISINFYIDLSKAFDSLNHEILLYKLSHYSVNSISSTLLRSYLSNRKQYATIGDVKSAVLSITTGVPLGSIIGSLLFNMRYPNSKHVYLTICGFFPHIGIEPDVVLE